MLTSRQGGFGWKGCVSVAEVNGQENCKAIDNLLVEKLKEENVSLVYENCSRYLNSFILANLIACIKEKGFAI